MVATVSFVTLDAHTTLCTHSLSHFHTWYPKTLTPPNTNGLAGDWLPPDQKGWWIWAPSPHWLFCEVQLSGISWLAAIQRSEVALSVCALLSNLLFLGARPLPHIKSHLTHLEHPHPYFISVPFFSAAALLREPIFMNWPLRGRNDRVCSGNKMKRSCDKCMKQHSIILPESPLCVFWCQVTQQRGTVRESSHRIFPVL